MLTIKNQTLFFALFIFSFFAIWLPSEAQKKEKDPLFVDSPVKAAILYFPSPALIRCLSHSKILETPRKTMIYRKIKYSDNTEFEQNIVIGINSEAKTESKYIFAGNVMIDGEMFVLNIDGGPFFNPGKDLKVKPEGLHELPPKGESPPKRIRPPADVLWQKELIVPQRKIKIDKKIGNQDLNYEIFMKSVFGMIGNLDYKLELTGKDKNIKGKTSYLLSGKGNLGKDKIVVQGTEIFKDYYELVEKYGKAEVLTTVRIYN